MRLAILTLAVIVGAGAQADEPSPLAEAARKERQRRKEVKDPPRTFTEADLGSSSTAGGGGDSTTDAASSSGTSGAEARTAEAAGAPTDSQKAQRGQQIQKEIDAQSERIRTVRKQLDEINRELADALAAAPGPRRQQLVRNREQGEQAVAEIEQRIAELQAEAARLGVTVSRPQ